MGYEISKRRVYGPNDTYCNGSGVSVLKSHQAEAQQTFEHFCAAPHAYPQAVFLVDLTTGKVLRSSGPDLRVVDRAMHAAWRRRYQRGTVSASA